MSSRASPYYQTYASHYPQAAYAAHYQYAPQPAQPQQQQQQQQPQTQAQRQPVAQYQTSTYTPEPAFDTRILGTTMRTIGTQHKVTRIPDEAVNYLALALRARLQDLVTAMAGAAAHRTDTQFDRPASLYAADGTPMWRLVVRADVAKQLAALEKIEREEETRKKRKKDGPGVTARNMSEDVRKKMSNAVATQAAGLGGKYSWMTAANAATPVPKPKPAAARQHRRLARLLLRVRPRRRRHTAAATAAAAAASSWARPYKDSAAEDDTRTAITMRDAMFVIEKERGHGGGRGAGRGWV
ncbi:transcription initiation factor TFIID component TAF4 [Pholiota molesta]|nr:transcription initiation factor TFIID component TAF4 [Pholiota molesta]